MLILELWGINFHAVVVFGLGKDLSFKSVLGRCATAEKRLQKRFLLENKDAKKILSNCPILLKNCSCFLTNCATLKITNTKKSKSPDLVTVVQNEHHLSKFDVYNAWFLI